MVGTKTVNKYIHHLPYDTWFIVLSVGKSGGLALGYFEKLNISVINSSLNMIHILCDISPLIKNCFVSFIYGALNIVGMRNQWNFLGQMNENNIHPWLLLGDFNFILQDSEKQGGNPANSFPPNFIRDKLVEMKMNDVYAFGNPFTWCNRRFKNPTQLILEKIDRGFVNDVWFSDLPHTRITNLARVFSDHSPIFLNCFHDEPNLYRPYKYFKCWQLNPDFKNVFSN